MIWRWDSGNKDPVQPRMCMLGLSLAMLCSAPAVQAAPPDGSSADAATAVKVPEDDEAELTPEQQRAAKLAERRAAHDLEGRQLPDLTQTPPLRRGGLTFGLGAAAALGGASGYPNDATKVDRAEFYANTGVGFGAAASLWLGYAIADWVVFGLAVNGGWVGPSEAYVRSGGAGFRVELFPAWPLGGHWRELGLMLEPGIGFAMVEADDGRLDPLIESGAASHLSMGLFYEGVRLWQFSMGPYAGVDLIWSSSSLNPTGLLGWRTVYYAGP